jgi:hypothetical protein
VGGKKCKELVVIKHVKISFEKLSRRCDTDDNMRVSESRCEIVNKFNLVTIVDVLWTR